MSNPSSVKTLDALKAKLRERLEIDIAQLSSFEHKGLGVTFKLKPFNRDGYDAVAAADIVEKDVAKWPEADQNKHLRYRRDKAYMLHGLLFEDGSKPDDEFVELLLKGSWDADNRRMIAEIQKLNPPREVLVSEYSAALAQSRMAIVLFRILKEAGCLTALRDWMLARDDSPKAKSLANDLRKWEEVLEPFEALIEAEDTAEHFGINVYNEQEEEPQD